MNSSLSREEIEQYKSEGVLYPIAALSAAEVREFRASLEAMIACAGTAIKRMDNSHLFFRWAYDLVTHPRILAAIEAVIGVEILVHSSRIFYKRPHTRDYVSWHQDGRYSGLNTFSAHTAWVALSESHTGNGCLRVVAGSHLNGVHPMIEKKDQDNLETNGQNIKISANDQRIRAVILKPGEMSLHHINVVHGSEANDSNLERVGFAITYMPPDNCEKLENHTFVAALGRGHYPGLRLLSQPPNFDVANGLEAHAQFVRERKRRNFSSEVLGRP